MHAQEVKRYAPRLLEHQKYLRCEEQLCGRRLPLGSHAPALCLFQLRSGNMGEARSWVVCPTWSHTLRFCALHLIAVALSWGAHSSHSRCRFAAIISSSARRGVYWGGSGGEGGWNYLAGQNIFIGAIRRTARSPPCNRSVRLAIPPTGCCKILARLRINPTDKWFFVMGTFIFSSTHACVPPRPVLVIDTFVAFHHAQLSEH